MPNVARDADEVCSFGDRENRGIGVWRLIPVISARVNVEPLAPACMHLGQCQRYTVVVRLGQMYTRPWTGSSVTRHRRCLGLRSQDSRPWP